MNADVLVIGSGQAGVPLATRLAGAGKKVILVERKNLGGTCVNAGCTPRKTIGPRARAPHAAPTAPRPGASPARGGETAAEGSGSPAPASSFARTRSSAKGAPEPRVAPSGRA